MPAIAVPIVNKSHHDLPAYATAGSAGLDVRAFLEAPIVLPPMGRAAIPTGLFVAIPVGWEGQIRPRSGLAINHGITCLNTPGTIDADYRGELKVILINLSDVPFTITDGTRIAQLVIAPVAQLQWHQVQELQTTSRGTGGFGHTGKE